MAANSATCRRTQPRGERLGGSSGQDADRTVGVHVDQVRAEHEGELAALLPCLGFLQIAPRGKDGPIRLSPLDAVAEPRNLGLLNGRSCSGGAWCRWSTR
jgi:hypothetical protein